MSNSDFSDRVVWITGASAGIGRAMAFEMADRGARLALSARREDKLNEIADDCNTDETLVVPLDVTDREGNKKVVEEIVDEYGRLDVAFFNAGVFGTLGDKAFDADVFEWNMDVNYFGIVYGIEAALPHLKESDEGYVVGMSSGAAYTPLARGSSYGSSKVAVKYMLDSLNHEWDVKEYDLDVSVICPGVVKTPMTEDEEFPYEPPPSFFEVSPEWSANYIADKMERRVHEIRFPFLFILGLKFLGLIPDPIHHWILKLADAATVDYE